MENYLIKTLAYDKQARIFFLENTKATKENCDHKNINKLLKTALAKTVSIAGLISGTLKGNQRISIKIIESSQKYKIFADADSEGNVRGYFNDALMNAHIDYSDNFTIEQLIGKEGYIQVIKDLGMDRMFTGTTKMLYGNITDDMAYYYEQSEQIPSIFHIITLVNEKNEIILNRGIMAQLLPGAPIGLINDIRRNIMENSSALENLPDKDFMNAPHLLFKDIDIIGNQKIQFFCGCSKEIFQSMLFSLDEQELYEAYQNDRPIELACNICGKKYSYDIRSIINKQKEVID